MSIGRHFSDAEIATIRALWHANPTAGRDRIAALAADKLGREVSAKGVENHKPVTLRRRRSACPRASSVHRPGPQPTMDRRPKASRGLPYVSGLEDMILEARRVWKRLRRISP